MSAEILDLAYIKELREAAFGSEDEEAFLDLLKTYVEGTEQALSGMTSALERGDLEKIARLAHTFKGSSANIGALAVTTALKDIESLAQSDNDQEKKMPQLIENARQMFQQTKKALQNQFNLP